MEWTSSRLAFGNNCSNRSGRSQNSINETCENSVAQIDRLFSEIDPDSGTFAFDQNVADVFDDMISRSVPLYADVQRSVPILTGLLNHDPIRVFDLGCSTGTSLIHLSASLQDRNLELFGIDNSPAMLEKCHEKLDTFGLPHPVSTICAQIEDYEISDASVVLMNYTLQFIPESDRPALLEKISAALKPGGFLLISEKVAHPQPATHDALTDLYFEYKKGRGYSELEISRKRDALENVLVPLTMERNMEMFSSAGFSRVEVMLKWFNFATFLCRV